MHHMLYIYAKVAMRRPNPTAYGQMVHVLSFKWLIYIQNGGHIYMFCIYIMYLCIFNIERAKNFGGNFHVNEPHKLISLLVLTQDLIFRLRKLLSSVDLYYMVAMRRTNPTAYGQMVHVLLFKWLIYIQNGGHIYICFAVKIFWIQCIYTYKLHMTVFSTFYDILQTITSQFY